MKAGVIALLVTLGNCNYLAISIFGQDALHKITVSRTATTKSTRDILHWVVQINTMIRFFKKYRKRMPRLVELCSIS